MTELGRRGSTVLRELKRIIPGSEKFGQHISTGLISDDKLDKTLEPMGISQRITLGLFIIRGVAGIDNDWNNAVQQSGISPAGAREAGTRVFSRIKFSETDPQTITPLKKEYFNAIASQKDTNDTQGATALLGLSPYLTPLILQTEQPSVVMELQKAWDKAMTGKDNSWSNIATQARDMTDDLAVQFIEKLFEQDLAKNIGRPGRPPSRQTMERRKNVYLLRDKSNNQVAEELQLAEFQLYETRSWLMENGLVEDKRKRVGEKIRKHKKRVSLSEQIENIKKNGILNNETELARILTLYLKGVAAGKIPKSIGHNAVIKIRALREAGVIPDRYHIKLVRSWAYPDNMTTVQISEETGVPLHMVNLILSVPKDRHALDKLESEVTIYEG